MIPMEIGGEGTRTFSPVSWRQIEEAIVALNGKERPFLVLEQAPEQHLSIMATGPGQYCCRLWDGTTGAEIGIVVPGRSSEPVALYLNEVGANELVDPETALRAAKFFAETGRPIPESDWQCPQVPPAALVPVRDTTASRRSCGSRTR
jgi:hypothetical protein